MNGCPFCGVMKRGHSLRCHVQACSARNKPTGGKDALAMVGSGSGNGGGNSRVGRVRMAAQPVGRVLPVKANAPDQARLQPSPEAGCSAFPFALRAADRMSAIIDEMVRDGQLDARSRLADARLDYGKPWAYAHTPNAESEALT